MIAYLLSISVLAYCYIVGVALQHTATRRVSFRMHPSLSAPTGLAFILTLGMFLNRLGLSIHAIAIPLLTFILAAALVLLWARRPVKRNGSHAWQLILLAVSVPFLSIGLPLATHGLGWLSFCNNDMIYYCTGATRLLQHGFSEPPSIPKLLDGKDLASEAWFAHVVLGHRNGAEYLLALVSAAANLSPTDVYMSVITSLLMILSLSLTSLLTCRGRRQFHWASIAVGAATPLCGPVLYGFLNQLMAQSLGLILSVGVIATARANIVSPCRARRLGRFGIFLLFLVTLLYSYVEIVPFTVLAVIMIAAAHVIRTHGVAPLRRLVAVALSSAATLNVLLVAPAMNLLANISAQSSSVKTSSVLFPYFLKPVGLLHFWGWLPLGQALRLSDMVVALLLCTAFALIIFTTCILVAGLSQRADASSAMALSMLCAVPYFYLRQNDFGLFKLSMFVFPFLIPPLASLVMGRREVLVRVILSMLVPAAALSSPQYVADARSPQRSTIPFAERSGLIDLVNMSAEKASAAVLIASTPTAAALFQNQRSFSSPEFTTRTPGYYFSAPGAGIPYPSEWWRNPLYFDVIEQGPAITRALGDSYKEREYLMSDRIYAWVGPAAPDTAFRVIDPSWPFPQTMGHGSCVLTFLPTSISQPFYGHNDPDRVAFWQPEIIEAFGVNEYQMGIGRDITFNTHNLPEKPILVFSYSTSLLKTADLRLRPVEVHGADGLNARLNACGIGMLRGWVGISEQRAYRLSTGRVPEYFPRSESSIQSLWGAELRLDPRKLTGYMRELRVIGERDLPPPPHSIERFPTDLLRADTFFSGICEDGWVGNECEVRLQGGGRVHIKGEVPALGDDVKQRVEVYVNGALAATRDYCSGTFLLKCVGEAADQVYDVKIKCSTSVSLPSPDGRPVCLKLNCIKVTD